MKSGSLNSSSRSRIWRLIADCETCRRAPAAVKEPLSAIARRISSCLRSMAVGQGVTKISHAPLPDLHSRWLTVLHRLEERHQRTQPRTDFLDFQVLLALALRVEPGATLAIFLDPLRRVRPVLDLLEHLLHFLARLFGHETRTAGVITVLRSVAHGVAHVVQASLIHQVDDELQLVKAFEVGDLGLIAGFDE